MLNQDEFFSRVNGHARTRLFNNSHYNSYLAAYREAERALAVGEPFYWQINAGGVAKSYGSITTTARCGIYVMNGIHEIVDRATISGPHVGCIFHGGSRSYFKRFKEA